MPPSRSPWLVHDERRSASMFCLADCERRERQRQMTNDEARSEAQAAREEFFRAVEPRSVRKADRQSSTA